jgi:hypothetical protein
MEVSDQLQATAALPTLNRLFTSIIKRTPLSDALRRSFGHLKIPVELINGFRTKYLQYRKSDTSVI